MEYAQQIKTQSSEFSYREQAYDALNVPAMTFDPDFQPFLNCTGHR
jgi:hypothetical protein